MHDQPSPNLVARPTPPSVSIEAEELIRDWEVLFCAFLLFGSGRLAWLYLFRPEHAAFHLGLSCGFTFCGVLGFVMRWIFRPQAKEKWNI